MTTPRFNAFTNAPRGSRLSRLVKIFALIVGAAIVYVLFDFSFDLRPAQIYSSYQFKLKDLKPDEPMLLRQDSLSIVVIRRSANSVDELRQSSEHLQDPQSKHSRQPDFAANSLRSKHVDYFVAYGIGTDLGCPLQEFAGKLGEICGKARYDFAGRALQGDNEFHNLAIPDYIFSNDFNTLTINP